MHRILVFLAYGWLTLSGTMHFVIDVLSQYLRGKRAPGPETTLYWGLNSAYSLGQVVFGVLALLVARRSIELMGRWPVVALSLGAAACWLLISVFFLEYLQPRFSIGLFAALVVAAAATA